ncbi:hypothetical protein BH18ACT14_BH18ACT14_18930 [soil metagenome]
MTVAGIQVRGVTLLVILAFVVAGCGSEKSSSPGASSSSGVTGSSETVAEGLPAPVSETRSAILAAAESGNYGPLQALVEPDVFLSDFGFGK